MSQGYNSVYIIPAGWFTDYWSRDDQVTHSNLLKSGQRPTSWSETQVIQNWASLITTGVVMESQVQIDQ